jgi:hypothetical protein
MEKISGFSSPPDDGPDVPAPQEDDSENSPPEEEESGEDFDDVGNDTDEIGSCSTPDENWEIMGGSCRYCDGSRDYVGGYDSTEERANSFCCIWDNGYNGGGERMGDTNIDTVKLACDDYDTEVQNFYWCYDGSCMKRSTQQSETPGNEEDIDENPNQGECSNWCATPEQCAESNGRRVPRPCDYDSCAEGTFACKVDDASSGGGSSDEGSPGGSGSSPPPSSCPSGQLSCTNSDKSHCENNWCGNRDTPGCCAPDSGESPDEGSPGGSGDSSGGSSGENTSPGDENPPENNDEPDDPNPNDDEELPARPTGTPRATSTPRPSPTPTPEPKAKRILFTTESCSPRMRNWIPLSTSEQESDWIRTRGVTYENPHSDFSKIQFPQTAPLVSSCKGKKVVVEGTMYVNSNNSTKFKGTTICKEDATCPTDTPLQATTARFIFSVAANEMISDTSELGQHSIENDFTLTLQRNGANAEYTVPMDARDEWYKGEQELEISGGTYTIMIKHAQSLPVIFANISLDKGDVLNCTSGDSQSCGELQYWRSDDKKLIMGDVNGDELIDNNDKSLIVTYYLNNVPDINTEIYNADLNKDGVVDGKDLAIWRRGSREARE